jgi:AbrB family looped-hinge helix DNA binding protein
MTHRIGSKGQVVVPKYLRERWGLGAGSSVSFEERDDGVLIRPEANGTTLAGRFKRSGMAAELLRDRGREPR